MCITAFAKHSITGTEERGFSHVCVLLWMIRITIILFIIIDHDQENQPLQTLQPAPASQSYLIFPAYIYGSITYRVIDQLSFPRL